MARTLACFSIQTALELGKENPAFIIQAEVARNKCMQSQNQ